MLYPFRPRLIIADSHRLIVAGLDKLLSSDFEVLLTVGDGRSLVNATQALLPDVILTEIGMPLMNGLEAIHRIKRLIPAIKAICVTANCDLEVISEAFRRGASGYVPKTASGAELISATWEVLRGERYISPTLLAHINAPGSAALNPEEIPLTERQMEVLQLLAEGRTMKEVGAVLNLTTRTIAFHKYRLMEALSLNTNAAVIQYAMQHRVVFA